MPQEPGGRRRFLSICTGAVLTLIGVLMAVPAIGFFLAPLRRGRGAGDEGHGFQDVGPVGDLPAGQWRLASLEVVSQNGWEKLRVRHGVWVRGKGGAGDQIDVLSSTCPHLGCLVNWHPDRSQFVCPCHGGIFDPDGARVAGPPARSMDRLEYQVRNGRLMVRWQDFKIGAAEPVVVRT
jgi:menaquinol-cytochrome c reductase iron-sulfur subunit